MRQINGVDSIPGIMPVGLPLLPLDLPAVAVDGDAPEVFDVLAPADDVAA